jgi:hypothetical protein
MKLKEIPVPLDIDPGATMPEIKADEHDLEVTFYLLYSDERGKLKFKSVLQFTFGYPNEEAIKGHRYYEFGLLPFKFVEVQDSEIIKNIVKANRVHHYHKDELFKEWKHFVFPFHDTTLEVIAKSYEFELPVKPEFNFYKTTMPETRKADYFLGCLGGSVFIDFCTSDNNEIYLKRISFDGYGCCELQNFENKLDQIDSEKFIQEISREFINQEIMGWLVTKLIKINATQIWKEALEVYKFI